MSEGLEGLQRDLFKSDDLSFQKILNELLRSDANLPLKTQIENPLNLAMLKTLASLLKIRKMKKSGKMIDDFIKVFLEYMVSYKRKSRAEIIDAVKHQLENEDNKQINQLLRRY